MSTVLLAGGTGLVGGHCLRRLVHEPAYSKVVVLTRRPFVAAAYPAAEKLEEWIVDWDRLGEDPAPLRVDAVICALGTTIKQAGSREQFRRVDLEYPLELARRCRESGASRFALVSAMGADPDSRIFYNRVKGEVEQAVRAVGFDHLSILRPSLLAGERDEFRLGEQVGLKLGFLFPPKYRPVHADDVAAVLVDRTVREDLPVRVIESAEIRQRADAKRAAAMGGPAQPGAA